mgnify:CR=1 FL=1
MQKIISGKVRDVYEIDDNHLVIVTTDRISAFDVILSKPVKDKGKVLNALSLFWFDCTKDIVKNHVLSDKLSDMPKFFRNSEFEERSILVEKLQILPFEFIVRGYMFGNMWSAYQDGKEFCGLKIEGNYQQAQKLETPILTPSTKTSEGHDTYVPFDYVINMRMRKGSLSRTQSLNSGWIKRIILSLRMKYSHPTQAVSGASRIIRSVCLPKAMTNSLFATGCSATKSAAKSSMITFRTQS